MIPRSAVLIRPGTVADLPDIMRIENDSFSDAWPRPVLLSELMEDEIHLPLVACRGREVLGYLLARRLPDHLHVLNIAVRARDRQQGVGSQLLADALTACHDRRFREVILEVRHSNIVARTFYERRGFETVGRRAGYYQDNGEDAVIMMKHLSEDDFADHAAGK